MHVVNIDIYSVRRGGRVAPDTRGGIGAPPKHAYIWIKTIPKSHAMNLNLIAIGLWLIVWLFGIVFIYIYACLGGCVTSTPGIRCNSSTPPDAIYMLRHTWMLMDSMRKQTYQCAQYKLKSLLKRNIRVAINFAGMLLVVCLQHMLLVEVLKSYGIGLQSNIQFSRQKCTNSFYFNTR